MDPVGLVDEMNVILSAARDARSDMETFRRDIIEAGGHSLVVTGASGGLGETVLPQLAGRGLNLILVARSVDKLEALAADLRAADKIGVEAAPADLNDPET